MVADLVQMKMGQQVVSNMNKMLLCTDTDLKQILLSKGFKIIKEESYGTIFALDNKLQFNFAKVDKHKYTLINKLTF